MMLIGSQNSDRKLDQILYEDMIRVLLGKDAYLLFVFDRLVHATLKNLLNFYQIDECQVSFALFKQMSSL